MVHTSLGTCESSAAQPKRSVFISTIASLVAVETFALPCQNQSISNKKLLFSVKYCFFTLCETYFKCVHVLHQTLKGLYLKNNCFSKLRPE